MKDMLRKVLTGFGQPDKQHKTQMGTID